MDDLEIINFEANTFALELLMPAEWVIDDARGLDLADDEGVAKLAKKYQVSASTMAYRIGMLRAEATNATTPTVGAIDAP